MTQQNAGSTLQTFEYDEEWEVSAGRDTFSLNGEEYAVLKDAIMKGIRSVIFFQDKAISIPFITSMYRRSRRLKKEFQLAAPKEEEYNPTPEEKARRQKILDEIKEKLKIGFSPDSRR